MSAMRVEQLPEVPAALPQDSARNRAAARWTARSQVAHSQITRRQVAHSQITRRQVAHSQITRGQVARSQPASVPLRLTRRGRVVAAVAAALLLAVLSLVIAGSAQATNHPVSSNAAQRNLAQVTVRPGQSLWSVAENADPDADTRVVIQQIVELNGLTGDTVFAGQRLWVPRG
jgi:hypothetical protein